MFLRLIAEMFDVRVPSPLRIAMFMVAVVALMIGFGFSAYGGYLAMASHIPAPWAAATVAGGALLAAVILITAAVQINRSASLEVAPRIPAPDIPPETFAELVRAIQSSPKEATLIALFAGLATGLYPELLTAARRFTRLR